MGMIVVAIVCGILANELFAWGPRLSNLLLKIAVNRMSPRLRDRMREEWQAHLDVLPGGLSKLSAAAGFLLSTFWGFRRYREDETPIEIEERIALEVALAINQERERIFGAIEAQSREVLAKSKAEVEFAEERLKETLKLTRENRTQLVKRRVHGRSYGFRLTSGYKTTRHKGSPYQYKGRMR
jgi:hypothetical protein